MCACKSECLCVCMYALVFVCVCVERWPRTKFLVLPFKRAFNSLRMGGVDLDGISNYFSRRNSISPEQHQNDVGTAGRRSSADHCDLKRISVTEHCYSNGSPNRKPFM